MNNKGPARKLLQMGADMDTQGIGPDDTPLERAIMREDTELTRELLNHGAKRR